MTTQQEARSSALMRARWGTTLGQCLLTCPAVGRPHLRAFVRTVVAQKTRSKA